MKRADYGLDAPGVVFGLGTAGLVMLGVYFALPRITGAAWAGSSMLITAALMLWSSRAGKRIERDRILDALQLRGDERVLDVGCGRGLYLIGAAARLTTGSATGVDMWQVQDQTGNSPDATRENARRESVSDKVDIRTGDARKLEFPDGVFDVVISSLVLHNIHASAQRAAALREIVRVTKPGGRIAILDIAHTAEYANVLRDSNVTDVRRSFPRPFIFPPSRLVSGRKA